MISLDWVDFKEFIDTYSLKIHWRETSKKYLMKGFDLAGLQYSCVINKQDPVPDPSDQKDFEDNYKSAGNVSATDHDNAPYMRMKGASKGWTFQARTMELKLATLNSLVNLDVNNSDYGDAVLKFYDASGNQLTAGTQAELDTSCVRTDLEWTATYDMELIGGRMNTLVVPSTDVRIWCQGAPVYGGPVMISGINFKFKNDIEIDGRVVKRMTHSAPIPGAYTNTLRKVIRHDLMNNTEFMIDWYHYKA